LIHETVKHIEREYARGDAHINNCENRASILRLWLSVHRGICKDNPTPYLTAFKASRRFRKINPLQAIEETIKTIYIVATKILVKSE